MAKQRTLSFQGLQLRLKKSLQFFGLGVSTTLLTVFLGLGTGTLPPLQQLGVNAAVPSSPVAQSLTDNSAQLVQAGRERYNAGQFSEAATLWQQAAQAFADKR
ncbi:MAG TPA: hypothetical protein V6C85_06335, partial [Allocoleopsis sp.]